jgi:multidrug efflux pump subunit AcrB
MKPYKINNIAGHLAKIFLANPLTPILAFAILLLGYVSLEVMPREEDPQIEVSGGSIIVGLPGATPKEIENVIVKPLERRIREIQGVEDVHGMAMNNVGILNVQYYIGQNREFSNLKLYDKVMQHIDKLPQGTTQPLVKPFDIDIDIPILTVAFYKDGSSKTDTIKLYQALRELQQDVNAIENVSKTMLKGVRKPQFNVMVDLQKLSAYHLSLGQVAKAIQSISSNAPEIDAKSSTGKLTVFGIKNAIENIDDLNNLIVAQYMGAPIHLRSLARVEYSYDIQSDQSMLFTYKDREESDSEFVKAGGQVTLTVSKLKGTNAVTIAQDVIEELAKNRHILQENGLKYTITRNYGDRANEAVNELVHHLEITIIIIAAILITFLGWRESLVVTIAVPMILALTLFIAYMSDQTINRITLFAFLLSLGLIVDDAIIVIENIHRRMHLPESEGLSFAQIIIEATDEIGPSTNIATIAIILTMVPMAFVGGMMGQFMTPIPLNVPVALAVSLFVAYVFAPYLAKKFLKYEEVNVSKQGN